MPRISIKARADDARKQDDAAAALIQSALLDGVLEPFLPGEVRGVAARVAARRATPRIVNGLARIYGFDAFDADAFKRFYLYRALPAWYQSVGIHDSATDVSVTALNCPLGEAAATDPRLCETCRLVTSQLARAALGTEARVEHERLVTHGDGACAFTVELRKTSDDAVS